LDGIHSIVDIIHINQSRSDKPRQGLGRIAGVLQPPVQIAQHVFVLKGRCYFLFNEEFIHNVPSGHGKLWDTLPVAEAHRLYYLSLSGNLKS